jgi:dTDP-4-amino-4,6-dideoxygalactose transaminase
MDGRGKPISYESGSAITVWLRLCRAVYLRYPFLASHKDKILQEARKHRVEFGDWFVSAVHPHSDSESEELGYRQGMCPVAERTAKEILTLPIYEKVRDRDVERSIDLLHKLHHQGLS